MIKKINIEEALNIRHKVMWPEKPLEYVKLPDDDKGEHFGYYVNTKLVSVISVFLSKDKAQFRKFATVNEYQGKGYGSALLTHVFKYLKEKDIKYIFCNARKNKISFYKKFDMKETGEPFEKGGKEYIKMEFFVN